MVSNILQGAAQIAVGHVVAHSIIKAMSPSEKEHYEREVAARPSNDYGSCSIQHQGFQKCLEQDGNDIGRCQWAWDMFYNCQNQTQGQQQQQSSSW